MASQVTPPPRTRTTASISPPSIVRADLSVVRDSPSYLHHAPISPRLIFGPAFDGSDDDWLEIELPSDPFGIVDGVDNTDTDSDSYGDSYSDSYSDSYGDTDSDVEDADLNETGETGEIGEIGQGEIGEIGEFGEIGEIEEGEMDGFELFSFDEFEGLPFDSVYFDQTRYSFTDLCISEDDDDIDDIIKNVVIRFLESEDEL